MNGKAMEVMNPDCPSCRVPWEQHMGIAGTCDKLQKARRALAILHIWAQHGGGGNLSPGNVMIFTADALKDTGWYGVEDIKNDTPPTYPTYTEAPKPEPQIWIRNQADTKEEGK